MSPGLWAHKILVLDDDHVTAQMVYAALRAQGYDCLLAHDGAQGWKLAQAEAPDALITDLMMPGEHGFQVIRRIKSDPQLRRMKIIVMSSSGSPQIMRAEAARQGVDAFFDKPFPPQELVAALRRLLGSADASAPHEQTDHRIVLP